MTMTKYRAARLLDLSGEITPEIVKKAWRRMARKYHPDLNPFGHEMMKRINAAYAFLKNFRGTIHIGAVESTSKPISRKRSSSDWVPGWAFTNAEPC